MQVERIEVRDAHGGDHPVDLAKLLARLSVVQHDACELGGARPQLRLKSLDLGADAVLRERVLDLPRDVAINVAEAVRDDGDQDERDQTDRQRDGCNEGAAPRERAAATALGRDWLRAVGVALSYGLGHRRQWL